MKNNRRIYKTSALFALEIALLMHLFFLIMFFFGRDVFMPPPHAPRMNLDLDFYHLTFSFLSNLLSLFIIFSLNFKILNSETKYKWTYTIVGTLLFVIVLKLLLFELQASLFSYEDRPPLRAIFGRTLSDCVLGLIVVFISRIVYLSQKRQETELEIKALNSENIKSRYEALKNQVDPHFLFNTLSSLSSMIELNPSKAQEYVAKLSSVFRYRLRNEETTTLDEELSFTRDYCQLMQIRYSDHLIFDFRIDSAYKERLLVPLSIQTLVENAIKHNVISKRNPLTITIATIHNGEALEVSNPIQQKQTAEEGDGIGLANLAERYRLKWNREITVLNKENNFRVIIPLITKP